MGVLCGGVLRSGGHVGDAVTKIAVRRIRSKPEQQHAEQPCPGTCCELLKHGSRINASTAESRQTLP